VAASSRKPLAPAFTASYAEVARALHLSEATIKTHLTRILAKLGLHDRTQAAVAAYESGLVQPGQLPSS
jgi:ATP/maltotriose-dependent transcriptional regulator MalT